MTWLTGLWRLAVPLRLLRLPAQRPGPHLPPGRWIDVPDRGRFRVREVGTGRPVILLHPWTWTADIAFGDILPALAEGYRVVAYDLRGHGHGPPIWDAIGLADYVDDVLAVSASVGLQRPILVGHSLGGLVAIATALRAPERLHGIVLVAAAACYQATVRDRVVWGIHGAVAPFARRQIGRRVPLRYFLSSLEANPALRERWHWLAAELSRTSVDAMWKVGAMVSDADLRPMLPDLKVPAVYVVLERDRVCLPRLQRDAAARMRATTISVEADHDAPLTATGAYLTALRESIAALSSE